MNDIIQEFLERLAAREYLNKLLFPRFFVNLHMLKIMPYNGLNFFKICFALNGNKFQ